MSSGAGAVEGSLAGLEGAALIQALRRRYRTVDGAVFAGGRPWRILRPRSADDLLDDDAFARDGRIPYWAEIWGSAPVLGDRLAGQPGRGRALLELGCGVGVLSLVAAAAGYRALATDYYPEALDFVRANAALNEVAPPAVRMIDWRRLPGDLGAFERVVAADVLYESGNIDLIAQALARTLAPGGTATIADPGRPTAARFAARCEGYGFSVNVDRIPVETAGRPSAVDLYEVTWRR
jgi:predicted nicotinamide N-methyase